MILGRPENKRKRILRTIMNEKEESAFLEYFQEWKTNREVTNSMHLCSNSIKNIDTDVGRYCNKFTSRGWLNKDKKYFRYSFKTIRNKEATKGQYVPAYKSNIKPFIDYFFLYATDKELGALSLGNLAFPTLYIFFELDEVREWIISLSKLTFGKPSNIYDSFLKVLEQELLFYWLYFEQRFYPNFSKVVLMEEFFINQIPDIENIKKLIEKYLKDKKVDFDKLKQREKIIELYNSSWKEFERKPCFKLISKINKAQNPNFPKTLLSKETKIKYFARILYFEPTVKVVMGAFLGYIANSLAYTQPKREQDPEHIKLLKYQLFKKKASS